VVYRREIDGLRAIAVLSVILFHSGMQTLSGGFVGVDVFFVISGYLITAIIVGDLENGIFSIARFYERRVRRILPALFFVIFACLPLAWLWLLPLDFRKFTDSIVAVVLFVSNHLFSNQSGYFDTTSELKPLLHTWTLAVEEQYYVIFPLFLAFTWRFERRWVVIALLVCFATSLAMAQWAIATGALRPFYLLPTRGWELLIGALSFFYSRSTAAQKKNSLVSEAASLLGAVFIAYAVLTFDSNTPVPSVYSLIPTLGAALIILYATEKTMVGKILSTKVLVGIGLISYSAYLWHQPLFAFLKYRSIDEPSRVMLVATGVLVMMLAYLSWKFVETPFRDRKRFSVKQVYLSLSLVAATFVIIGLWSNSNGGFPQRFLGPIQQLHQPNSGALAKCAGRQGLGCLLGKESVNPSIAVLGDSHSGVLERAFSDALTSRGLAAIAFQGAKCVPLLGVAEIRKFSQSTCQELISSAVKRVIEDPKIDTVVLVAEWSNYTTGYRWGDQSVTHYSDEFTKLPSLQENLAVVRRGIDRTVGALKNAGKKVVIVKSVPEYAVHIPTHLAKLMLFSGNLDLGPKAISSDEYLRRNQAIEAIFLSPAVASKVVFVDSMKVFCPTGWCKYVDGVNPFYVDGNHLSNTGANILVPAILTALER
jgi:peptidoglycan/LPS O-acetylase OafA/YrhL